MKSCAAAPRGKAGFSCSKAVPFSSDLQDRAGSSGDRRDPVLDLLPTEEDRLPCLELVGPRLAIRAAAEEVHPTVEGPLVGEQHNDRDFSTVVDVRLDLRRRAVGGAVVLDVLALQHVLDWVRGGERAPLRSVDTEDCVDQLGVERIGQLLDRLLDPPGPVARCAGKSVRAVAGAAGAR